MRWYGKARARDRVKLLPLLQSLSLPRLWDRIMETQTRKIQRRPRLNAVGNKPWKQKDEWTNGCMNQWMDISGNRKCEKVRNNYGWSTLEGIFKTNINSPPLSIWHFERENLSLYCVVDYTFSFHPFFSSRYYTEVKQLLEWIFIVASTILFVTSTILIMCDSRKVVF